MTVKYVKVADVTTVFYSEIVDFVDDLGLSMDLAAPKPRNISRERYLELVVEFLKSKGFRSAKSTDVRYSPFNLSHVSLDEEDYVVYLLHGGKS